MKSVPGVTVKIPSRVRDRLKALARGSSKTMGRVLEEAVTCYERNLRDDRYLEGWTRFQRDEPEALADYLRESEEIQATLTDALPEQATRAGRDLVGGPGASRRPRTGGSAPAGPGRLRLGHEPSPLQPGLDRTFEHKASRTPRPHPPPRR